MKLYRVNMWINSEQFQTTDTREMSLDWVLRMVERVVKYNDSSEENVCVEVRTRYVGEVE